MDCVCGMPEGQNYDCERCKLLRMGGVLSRLVARLADRLVELGESPALTKEEVSAFFRISSEETELMLKEFGIDPTST